MYLGERDRCAALDYSLIISPLKLKMNKVILHGLALLLLCGMAQSLMCLSHCEGDPCDPVFCEASEGDRCFTNQIEDVQGTKREEDDVPISLLDLEKTGCTTEANRHLCDTVRTGKLKLGEFKIRLKVNMTCCDSDLCNYADTKDVPPQ